MGNPHGKPPPEVEEAARRRSEARAARDWATADALRGEIEAAGWKVVDAGTDFRLERASPPDVVIGGEIRYGRSDAVPSRLDEPATGLATVVLVASSSRDETLAAMRGVLEGAPGGVDVVVVADGLADDAVDGLMGSDDASVELIRTSARLGHAAALNAGIRRARAPIVITIDPSIVAEGDVITALVQALDDPDVAIAGPFGLTSPDLRRFEEIATGSAVAIQGYLQAFRRADYVERGPLDEGFRYYRNLDIWWSLVLRDQGEGRQPRRASVVADLPLRRGDVRAWIDTPPAERDRLSKRNFYRLLGRFRTRLDMAG